VELTASDEGIPQKEWSRVSLDPLIQKKLMLMVRLTVYPGSCHPKSAIMTDNNVLPFVQDLICSQNDEVMHPGLWWW